MTSRIRVATYNLYLGADLSGLLGDPPPEESEARRNEAQRQLETTAFPARARMIAKALSAEQVDLVGLQEVCVWKRDGEVVWDYCRLLLEELDALGTPYDVVAGQPSFHGAGTVEAGEQAVTLELHGRNAVLLRRGSAIEAEASDSGLFGSALRVPLMGGAEVSIERGWCSVRCVVGGARFTFVDTHTEAYDPASRDRQRDELVAVLPDGPLVLVGDFNATPDEVGMPEDLRDAWSEAGGTEDPNAAATCCQAADLRNADSELSERIDYVWVRGLGVESCVRIGAHAEECARRARWPSDHAGVVATLTLEEQRSDQPEE
jgi:endonuclease/exonuclease/phosphatase family metal-dependent hydrolase